MKKVKNLNLRVGKYFKLEEFKVSQTYPELAKKIEFTELDVVKLKYFCATLLDPLRDVFGPIYILSGKRTPELNEAVGGARHSHHLYEGLNCAADFCLKDKKELWFCYQYIILLFPYAFSQCILYYKNGKPNFIHLSLNNGEEKLVKEVRGKTRKK